jgi:putative inorganic carbon (HCO3(-)) transporter
MIEYRSNSWRHSPSFMFLASFLLIAIGALVWTGIASSLFVVVALLGTAVLLAALLPPAGVVGVLAALPMMYELHPMPRGQFSLLELAILVTAVGTSLNVLAQLRNRSWDGVRSLVVPAQIVVPVVLLVLATSVSLLTIADPAHRAESLREVRTVIVEPLIFLATARLVLRDNVWRNWVGTAFILVGFVIAVLALIQVAFDLGGVAAGSVLRATGPYTHPNNLALFLERTLLFTTAVVFLKPRWWSVWVIVAIQLFGVAVTYSRGALLAVMVTIACLMLLLGMYRWLGVLAAGGLLVGGVAFLFAPERLIDAGGSGSEPTRFALWRSSVRMGLDHPVFGVGPDQFLYQYWRRYVEPMGWPERYSSHPHNLVLDVWLRLGVMGLAAFATLIVGLIWWVRGSFDCIRGDIWSMGSVAALAGGVAHGMVDQGIFLPDLATMTWLFVAFLITTGTTGPTDRSLRPGQARTAAPGALDASRVG